mgnify:CR=1 FL=1
MRLISLFFLVLTIKTPCGEPRDYAAHFGKDYIFAEQFISENTSLLEFYFPDDTDRQLASAVIFPELIRYNALRDIIEISVLKALYIQYGSHYANFSVGPFQIKPSFAEKLEARWHKKEQAQEDNETLTGLPGRDPESRAARLERLAVPAGQIIYLKMFILLMNDRFAGHEFQSVEDRIRIYATAYNAGMDLSTERLRVLSKLKHFHTGLFENSNTAYYNYSDIALYYFMTNRH